MIPDSLRDAILTEVPKLQGWTTPDRCIELAELVLQHGPVNCVEIGTFEGRTAIAIGFALQHLGAGQLATIDPFKTADAIEGENPQNQEWWSKMVDLHDIHRRMMENIWRLGLDRFVIPIRSASQHCAPLFHDIHFLNIDGNHSETSSTRDVELFVPRVISGGLIHCDDADWPSTQKAMALICESCDVIKDATHWKIFRKR